MTYVCANLDEETKKKLGDYARRIGIEADKVHDPLHVTIVYSTDPLLLKHQTVPLKGVLTPVRLNYMGADESAYRALVVEVESTVLQYRYEHYVAGGYKPRFAKYRQHVSLAYKPPEGLDVRRLPLPDFKFTVCSETIMALNENV
jgi:hypothetical protein